MPFFGPAEKKVTDLNNIQNNSFTLSVGSSSLVKPIGCLLPSSGVARFHPFGSFRGGSGSETSIDKISKLSEEAMRPVCAASTVLEAKDWRVMY